MNNIQTKITKEEKDNILDKHKSLYDGYSVRQQQSNEYPLYVQDLANDKGGLTLTSKNEVSKYNNNIYMTESVNEGMKCEQCGGEVVDGICTECYEEASADLSGEFDYVEEEDIDFDSDLAESDYLEESAKENLKKSLDMFKRFTKYN